MGDIIVYGYLGEAKVSRDDLIKLSNCCLPGSPDDPNQITIPQSKIRIIQEKITSFGIELKAASPN